jgi:hypothetical protein
VGRTNGYHRRRLVAIYTIAALDRFAVKGLVERTGHYLNSPPNLVSGVLDLVKAYRDQLEHIPFLATQSHTRSLGTP